jgi:hypothetical protein
LLSASSVAASFAFEILILKTPLQPSAGAEVGATSRFGGEATTRTVTRAAQTRFAPRFRWRLALRLRSPAAARNGTAVEALCFGVGQIELAHSLGASAKVIRTVAPLPSAISSPDMSDTRTVLFAIS